jgi:integrase
MPSWPTPARDPYVEATKARGKIYLYYRREGHRYPLAGPEGSAAFRSDYDRIHAKFKRPLSPWNNHTLGQAIADYLTSADYTKLAPSTQGNYRRELDEISTTNGSVYIGHIDASWMERLRDANADQPYRWNSIRSRMIAVFDRYKRMHPKRLPENPWRAVRRLTPDQSDQNRPWPDSVLLTVLEHATREFRALLVTLLLTGQRISDVVAFRPEQYDKVQRTLRHRQDKTDNDQVLHVPEPLAVIFDGMARRGHDRLLVTPRGRPWKSINAEATLLVLRRNLKLPRYTLHGLRATGPTALKALGFENRAIRALTGHDSDRNLELYLRGVASYPMAKVAQDTLATRFAEVMAQSSAGGNKNRFSGLTGRAAARAKSASAVTSASPIVATRGGSAKQVPNAKRQRGG